MFKQSKSHGKVASIIQHLLSTSAFLGVQTLLKKGLSVVEMLKLTGDFEQCFHIVLNI